MSNTPVETIRVGRGSKATIWANKTKNDTWHSVQISRTYKDKDGKLQDSSSFTTDQLPFVEKAADAAWRYIHTIARFH